MSMQNRTIGSRLDRWRFLIDQSRPLLAEAPHLAADHAAFEAVLREVEILRAEAVVAGNASQLAYRKRREAEARGEDLRDRLTGALVHQFGARSEKLIDFGVTPKSSVRRKKAPAPGPDQPAAPRARTDAAPAPAPAHPTAAAPQHPSGDS